MMSGNNTGQINVNIVNKPIKKKALELEEDENDSPAEEYASNNDGSNVQLMESKARKDLRLFLANKGVEEYYSDAYRIHVRVRKAKKSDVHRDPGYSVTYTCPNGSILTSKSDVLNSILDSRRRNQNINNKLVGTSSLRTDAHENAKHDISIMAFPHLFGDIVVICIGELTTKAEFCSATQLYPIGYQCEQHVTITSMYKGTVSQTIVCEIVDLDGYPEFRITIKSTGETFLSSSEAAVWKKFNSGNVETDWNPSFFNLDIERLIEGLDNALHCEGYKFHAERGYGSTYFTNEESVAAKQALAAKSGRERRNQDRQRSRFLSKEEQERLAENQAKKLQEEKEYNKKLLAAERERKEREREEAKQRKKEEARKRELQRSSDKSNKERLRKNDKVRQQLRKEVANEMRKSRVEASVAVLQFFDDEEEAEEQAEHWTASISGAGSHGNSHLDNNTSVSDFLISLPDLDEDLELDRQSSQESRGLGAAGGSFDDVVKIAGTLQLFAQPLGLTGISMDNLLRCIGHVSTSPPDTVCLSESQQAVPAPQQGVSTTEMELRNDSSDAAQILSEQLPSSALGSIDQTSAATIEMEVVSSSEKMAASSADEEDEWDEQCAPDGENALDSVPLPPIASSLAENQSTSFLPEAELDKMQLGLVQCLLRDLHTLLDLEDASTSPQLPLNQLTWPELARMAILQHIFSELGRSKEDVQHAVRGAKQPGFRSAKNVVRNIRYRMFVRSNLNGQSSETESVDNKHMQQLCPPCGSKSGIDDRLLVLGSAGGVASSSEALNKVLPTDNAFNSEQEIVSALETVAADASRYSEAYRRCSKVLLRLLGLSASKNLVWEVDSELYPDYYCTVARPIMLANIATRLVNATYSEGVADAANEEEYVSVAGQFRRDLQQVVVNCFAYNTEITLVVAQAQKLLLAAHRHIDCWVLGADRPSVEQCDEKFCLMTGRFIQTNIQGTTVKCGKCSGCFSYDAIFNPDEVGLASHLQRFLVLPTTAVLDQVSDEWVCPLCLREDSRSLASEANSPFYIDEWGPSSHIPWLLNPAHSSQLVQSRESIPYLESLLDALVLLTEKCCGRASYPCSSESEIQSSKHIDKFGNWSVSERVVVLNALCQVFRSSGKSLDHLQRVYSDCDKLVRLSNKVSFREADFMDVVRDVSGEEGVALCRSMLDGIELAPQDAHLHTMITEGRCVVCNGSTYEEDMEEVDPDSDEPLDNEIVLCDGCNAEVHLKCLNLSVVPSTEWHCSSCSDRLQQRDAKLDHTFDNIDKQRDREAEDELLERSVDLRSDQSGPSLDDSDVKCLYCGLGEFDLCSPMVVAQSRAEHEAALAACRPPTADLFFPDRAGTAVHFLIDGEELSPPNFDFPFFPTLESEAGNKLQDVARSMRLGVPVAHQMCALQLFQARVNRSRHNLRRRRKMVGLRAVSMSGISTKPLGIDDRGWEYWRLPTSRDLFVCLNGACDSDRTEFQKLIGASPVEQRAAPDSRKRWRRVTDVEGIRRVTELLGTSAREVDLRRNIVLMLLADRKPVPSVSSLALASPADEQLEPVAEGVSVSKSQLSFSDLGADQTKTKKPVGPADNVPASLQLLPNKGHEILRSYVIAEESVFEQSSAHDSEEESGLEYFTFSKSRKYYGIALMNASGGLIRANSRTGLTIVYQIHREGVAAPLTYAPLSEPWTDHMYYFSTVQFKRSGRYTVSFIAEGANAGIIKPLIFPVVVEAQLVRCGIPDALSKLQATSFVTAPGRQVLTGRREINAIIAETRSEIAALRSALMSVYAALPVGSLSMEAESETLSHLECVTEPAGWNDVLDQVWRAAVQRASSPLDLMECVLLLEHYLNKAWLTTPMNKLLAALPNPHFATRSATMSSVALRIYCLDRALDYDKVLNAPRDRRASNQQDAAGESQQKSSGSRLREAAQRGSYTEPLAVVNQGRSQRTAATLATARIRTITTEDDGYTALGAKRSRVSRDRSDEDDGQLEAKRASVSSLQWSCLSCSTLNEPRARSCETCGDRKPAVSVLEAAQGVDETYGHSQQRRKTKSRRYDSEEEEDEDDESDEDEQSRGSEQSGTEQPTRSSSRKRTGGGSLYFEDSDEEGEPAPQPSKRSKTSGGSNGGDYYAAFQSQLPLRIEQFDKLIARQLLRSDSEGETLAPSLDANIRFLSILRRLVTLIRTQPFWEPVDTRAVPSYRRYVSQPMDLGTVTQRVIGGHYEALEDPGEAFANDVRLVWSNCQIFNLEDSALHQDAVILSGTFEDLYQQWIISSDRPLDPNILE